MQVYLVRFYNLSGEPYWFLKPFSQTNAPFFIFNCLTLPGAVPCHSLHPLSASNNAAVLSIQSMKGLCPLIDARNLGCLGHAPSKQGETGLTFEMMNPLSVH